MTSQLESRDQAPQTRTAPKGLAVLLTVGGSVGLVAAIVLTIDKLKILANPDFVPSCDLGSVLSCSSIMKSDQAEAFGFPNSLLGLVGFSIVITIGVVLLAKAPLAEWIWAGLQGGVLLGVVFVHWLIYQSLFEIKFLCPYCMAVWAVTIPIFFYVTVRNLSVWAPGSRFVGFIRDWHALLVSLWIVAIAAGVLVRFSDTLFA